MTQEEEDRVNEMMQLAQVGDTPPTVTPGYGTYPVGDQSAALMTMMPTVPTPVTA